MQHIASLHNPRLKDAARLRDRRGRQQQEQFLIDGARELRKALAAGVEIVEVFLPDDAVELNYALLRELASRGVNVATVAPAAFRKLAYGEREAGIVAVARTPQYTLADMCPEESLPGRPEASATPLIMVLESVEKPGNIGAVLRTAAAAGATALIVADPGTDLYNPNTIRSSLGALFELPVCAASATDVLAWLRRWKFHLFAARVDASRGYTAVDYRLPTALVLGSEAAGLSEVWRGEDIVDVSIPMLGSVDSLNVSVTAAVLLYEVLRQRSG